MRSTRKSQTGVSLFIVIVVVMLTALLALQSSRTSLFNEMIVGNDADYQRTQEAAEALIQDASLDILGMTADGNSCLLDSKKKCRSNSDVTQLITERTEIEGFVALLAPKPSKCSHGLCSLREGAQDFWNNPAALALMVKDGARYGEHTGAPISAASNTVLQERTEGRGGWYWIEVMKYGEDNKLSNILEGAGSTAINSPLIYRITAVANGRKPNMQVVLQSVVALPPLTGE